MKLADMNRLSVSTDQEIEDLELGAAELFSYHSWDEAQKHQGDNVRDALKEAYIAVIKSVPPCATRTRALNMIVDARMLANAAITFEGEV